MPTSLSERASSRPRRGTAGEKVSSVGRSGARDGRAFRAIEQDRTRLAEEVYRQVLDAVVQGELRPGERIVQERIADELEVSRTPIREALLDLEREGILTRAGAAGFMVRTVTAREVRDTYQAREAIEGHTTRLVAERRDAASLRRIEHTIETEESISVGSVEEYFHANRRIHRRIVEEAGVETFFRQPLHPYSLRLLRAAAAARDRAVGRSEATGLLPPAVEGCAYAPRCPLAEPACAASVPDPAEPASGRWVRCLRAAAIANGEVAV